MSVANQQTLLAQVATQPGPRRRARHVAGLPKSAYYRWRSRSGPERLSGGPSPWNRVTAAERQRLLTAATATPNWSSRQLAVWLTDHQGFAVSTATV